MKQKYRILQKRYSDGSTWYLPQFGDWWHGWRYICKRHPCPDVGLVRVAYTSLEAAEDHLKRVIEFEKSSANRSGGITSGVTCIYIKLHDMPVSDQKV